MPPKSHVFKFWKHIPSATPKSFWTTGPLRHKMWRCEFCVVETPKSFERIRTSRTTPDRYPCIYAFCWVEYFPQNFPMPRTTGFPVSAPVFQVVGITLRRNSSARSRKCRPHQPPPSLIELQSDSVWIRDESQISNSLLSPNEK